MKKSEIISMFDSLEQGVLLVNRQGELILCNGVFKCLMEAHGLKAVCGESVVNLLTGEWRNVADQILNSCRGTGFPITLEISLTNNEARECFYELKFKSMSFFDSNEFNCILVQVRDVTTQKIYETKAIALARQYQSLVENANAMIFAVDSRGYITEWNHTSACVTGFTKDDAYTQKLIPLTVMDDSCSVINQVIESALNGKSTTSCEAMIKAKHGAPVALLMNASPKLNATGKVVGVLFIAQDITELTAYRNLLEQKVAERTHELQKALTKQKEIIQARDRFVAMAAHEFKSPISYILNAISKLKLVHNGMGGLESNDHYAGIETQLRHMSAFLGEILDVEKNLTHGIESRLTQLDLLSFFRSLIADVENSTGNTHRIIFNHSISSPYAYLDDRILRNVFVNLLTNAIKFSPGRESIVLNVCERVGYLVMSVKDHGIGIKEEELSKIFDSFVRGGNVGAIPGTGLGLSIVKKSVEILGGTIEVSSELGMGSCITVCVPSAGQVVLVDARKLSKEYGV